MWTDPSKRDWSAIGFHWPPTGPPNKPKQGNLFKGCVLVNDSRCRTNSITKYAGSYVSH